MKIFVDFTKSEILVNAKFNISNHSGLFSINKNLKIDEILIDDKPCEIKYIETFNPLYKAESIRYQLINPGMILKIKYHGQLNGTQNIISDELINVNMYSNWFISEFINEECECYIKKKEGYTCLKATEYAEYHLLENLDQDINITMVNDKLVTKLESKNVNVYFFSDNSAPCAQLIAREFEHHTKYYNSIFKKICNAKFDFLLMDMLPQSGGYMRKEFIASTSITTDWIADLVGHELAHFWFNKADTSSWEDWLNETGAEFTSFLYQYKFSDINVVGKYLKQYENQIKNKPLIKTKDGHRPNDVHDIGTYLFVKLFEKYGYDEMLVILNTLADLKHMETDNFIKAINNKEIADDIENFITTCEI